MILRVNTWDISDDTQIKHIRDDTQIKHISDDTQIKHIRQKPLNLVVASLKLANWTSKTEVTDKVEWSLTKWSPAWSEVSISCVPACEARPFRRSEMKMMKTTVTHIILIRRLRWDECFVHFHNSTRSTNRETILQSFVQFTLCIRRSQFCCHNMANTNILCETTEQVEEIKKSINRPFQGGNFTWMNSIAASPVIECGDIISGMLAYFMLVVYAKIDYYVVQNSVMAFDDTIFTVMMTSWDVALSCKL